MTLNYSQENTRLLGQTILQKNRLYILQTTLISMLAILLCSWLSFSIYDHYFPIVLKAKSHASLVRADDGTPLRAFADKNGVWRYPIDLDQVSPLYLSALINYEDRQFFQHSGVNLSSLFRATFQALRYGRIVSGGSTITMQTARMLKKPKRTLIGKLQQIIYAWQLEKHYSKEEILFYYINHAPFGGPYEGVNTASHAYFGHSAALLSHSQAALLAVLPQSPTRHRPDRHAKVAQQARDKVLTRLEKFNIWEQQIVIEAQQENINTWPLEKPQTAALLARRLKNSFPNKPAIDSFIDINLQQNLENLVADYVEQLPSKVSAAVMVMENPSGKVKAYLGSADFSNTTRFAHVDMISAYRSPGSTLKPFIYAKALDLGLIHSHSLLLDVPAVYGHYQPTNFHRHFSGPVNASSALKQSLNLPAVQLLDHIGPHKLYTDLKRTGLKFNFAKAAKPNISMALGGVSTRFEDLMSLYSSLTNKGLAVKVRLTQNTMASSQRLMSEGAAWIIYQALLPEKNNTISHTLANLAIKTGTSYGLRDAWAFASAKNYTLGVWIGRPDGVPSPGQFGSHTAVPLLKQVATQINHLGGTIAKPSSVEKMDICWPSGKAKRHSSPTHCDQIHAAYILDQTIPATLPSNKEDKYELTSMLKLDLSDNNKLIPTNCFIEAKSSKVIQLWPISSEPWLEKQWQRKHKIPPIDERCQASAVLDEKISIKGLQDGERILRKNQQELSFKLSVLGGRGPWYWFANGEQVIQAQTMAFSPSRLGQYQIIVLDQSGQLDEINIEIE